MQYQIWFEDKDSPFEEERKRTGVARQPVSEVQEEMFYYSVPVMIHPHVQGPILLQGKASFRCV